MPVDLVSLRGFPWAAAATDADWEEVYATQLPRVYNFFRYRVGNTADVEDLTAATFEKAWRARHRYRRDLASFATWLLAIARHVAVDYHRSRRHDAPLDDAMDVVAPGRTAEQAAVLQSEADRLAMLLAAVPVREREIISLKYGADMTNRDIAKVMGLSESNVGTILYRTLQALRAAMGPSTGC